MNAGNLGTVFSTHILCPRKLAPESLQSNHQLFSRAVTFMIGTIAFILEVPTGQDYREFVGFTDGAVAYRHTAVYFRGSGVGWVTVFATILLFKSMCFVFHDEN